MKKFLALSLPFFAALNLLAQGTSFTYNGRLNDGAGPANGSYDLTFALFDAASGGTQVGVKLTNSAVELSNGAFAVILDFGGQFTGAGRWLELTVRTNGTGSFTTLVPRQAMLPTPYSIYSATAGTALSASNAATAATVTGSVGAGQITGILPLAVCRT